jgi:hypothetical protein
MEAKMQPGEKMFLRLPPEIKSWLEKDAKRNDRSMNGQVVALLRERMVMQYQAEYGQEGRSENI